MIDRHASTQDRPRRSRAGRLLRDRRGATAVEIGLLAPLFLVILCAWVEVGLCLMMVSALDNAARDASRLIRIGTATEASFKAAICAKAAPIIPCAKVVYKVQSGSSFAGLSAVAVSSTGTLSSTGYSGGASGSDVLVQVAYPKPAFFSSLLKAAGFSGNILIMTTLAFQNEDY